MFGPGGLEGTVLILLGVLVFLALAPAVQAKRRGYSLIVWLVAGVLVFNPIYLLLILSISPHRKRQQMRMDFRRELDAKSALAGTPAGSPAARPVTARSPGAPQTVLPGAPAAARAPP